MKRFDGRFDEGFDGGFDERFNGRFDGGSDGGFDERFDGRFVALTRRAASRMLCFILAPLSAAISLILAVLPP